MPTTAEDPSRSYIVKQGGFRDPILDAVANLGRPSNNDGPYNAKISSSRKLNTTIPSIPTPGHLTPSIGTYSHTHLPISQLNTNANPSLASIPYLNSGMNASQATFHSFAGNERQGKGGGGLPVFSMTPNGGLRISNSGGVSGGGATNASINPLLGNGNGNGLGAGTATRKKGGDKTPLYLAKAPRQPKPSHAPNPNRNNLSPPKPTNPLTLTKTSSRDPPPNDPITLPQIQIQSKLVLPSSFPKPPPPPMPAMQPLPKFAPVAEPEVDVLARRKEGGGG